MLKGTFLCLGIWAKDPYQGQQEVKYSHILNRTAKKLSDTRLLSFPRGGHIGLSAVIPTIPSSLRNRSPNLLKREVGSKHGILGFFHSLPYLGGKAGKAVPVGE